MGATSIEWTDHSISPIRARSKETGKVFHFCERISPGCARCYAATMAQRFGLPDYVKANRDKVEFFLDESKLHDVLKRKKPTRFFWEDCSDLFGDWVSDGWLMRCLDVMARTPWHTHQILTKRPERMRNFFRCWGDLTGEDGELKLVRGPDETRKAHPSPRGQLFAAMLESMGEPPPGYAYPTFDWMEGMIGWPSVFPQIWCGVSVENQQYADERIPFLLQTPAAVRFLSCEPLLGPVKLADVSGWLDKARWWGKTILGGPDGLHWVITGCESGPNRRPWQAEWDVAIQRQCESAGIAFFRKQIIVNGRVSGEMSEWPEELRVRWFPVSVSTSGASLAGVFRGVGEGCNES